MSRPCQCINSAVKANSKRPYPLPFSRVPWHWIQVFVRPVVVSCQNLTQGNPFLRAVKVRDVLYHRALPLAKADLGCSTFRSGRLNFIASLVYYVTDWMLGVRLPQHSHLSPRRMRLFYYYSRTCPSLGRCPKSSDRDTMTEVLVKIYLECGIHWVLKPTNKIRHGLVAGEYVRLLPLWAPPALGASRTDPSSGAFTLPWRIRLTAC
jgi:hypothetical protein